MTHKELYVHGVFVMNNNVAWNLIHAKFQCKNLFHEHLGVV